MTVDSTNSAAAAIQGIANSNTFALSSKVAEKSPKEALEPLYKLIAKHIPQDDPRSVCVIFDNLSALSPVVGEETLITLAQTTRALVESHSEAHNNNSSVLALAHSDVDSLLVNSLSYSADLVLKVDGFKTGYSNEEDGQVRSSRPPTPKQLFPIIRTLLTALCYSSPSSRRTLSSIETTSSPSSSTSSPSRRLTSESFASESTFRSPTAPTHVHFVL